VNGKLVPLDYELRNGRHGRHPDLQGAGRGDRRRTGSDGSRRRAPATRSGSGSVASGARTPSRTAGSNSSG
jgi:hypothetical protein